ncbi:MAG: YgiT-type zinc finger protein [Deltaproteobacteria bacterium]|nr:YgiT-type zinc finger protein [Deltaproteobacteria bacterium]
MHDYGECHVCRGRVREKRVKQEFWVKGKLVVVKDVPAGVCVTCGEKVVRAPVGRRIAALLGDAKRRRGARTMTIPVIKFETQVA